MPRLTCGQEIQPDHFHIATDEALIPVAHYSKEPHNTFGIPFLMKLSDVSSAS